MLSAPQLEIPHVPSTPSSVAGSRSLLNVNEDQGRSGNPRRCSAASADVEASLKRKSFAAAMSQLRKSGTFQVTESGNTMQSSRAGRDEPCKLSILHLADLLLDSKLFSSFLTLLTVFVLVGDDIRLIAFEKSADMVFNVITLFALFIFTLELVLSCVAKDDYFLGFWFWLDTIATASLVFDLSWVNQAMMGYPEISLENSDGSHNEGAVGQSEYARASRSSRVGTRVARLLRVVRLMRMGRLMKCCYTCWKTPSKDTPVAPGEAVEDKFQNVVGSESRVGKKLSEKTTQRVIVLVLVMLVCLPQLDPGQAHQFLPSSAQYGADVIARSWGNYERELLRGASASELQSLRKDWELETLMYIYYHNIHSTCPGETSGEQDCASDFIIKLCFIGYVLNPGVGIDGLDNMQEGYIQELAPSSTSWSTLFSSNGWEENRYIVGTIPDFVKEKLSSPWSDPCNEGSSTIKGVSLLSGIPCPRHAFRPQETMWYMPRLTKRSFFNNHLQGQFVFVFDLRKRLDWQAFMGIMQTVFVVIVLAIGALFFSKDVDNLVLLPIERMISKVEVIRKDPLYAIKLGDQQRRENQEVPKKESTQRHLSPKQFIGAGGRLRRRMANRLANPPKKASLETKILENTIIKLGTLLAIGFGEAGSEIIGQNLDDDNANVNVMISGSKVEAIYGLCHVRNFTIITGVLREKTIVFVNQVAEIVHRLGDEHLGAPNKNLGEAFLLVWRTGRHAQEHRSKLADMAVMSFILIVAELNRDSHLADYREHPALLARLPNFRVSLGFGLHQGWSIEGAIGSEFKIDASYLSPHVNTASMLEAETSEYGVTILMSEPLVRFCNPPFRKHFRPVDHIMFQGSKMPTRLYTVDLDYENVEVDSEVKDRKKRHMNRFESREHREKMKMRKLEPDYQVHKVFSADPNVLVMRERYSEEFFQEYEKGYMNYEAGEWNVASEVLRSTRSMLCADMDEDGPSCALLDFMSRHNFQAPSGWKGYRDHSEKEHAFEHERQELLAKLRLEVAPTSEPRKLSPSVSAAHMPTKALPEESPADNSNVAP